MAFDRPAESGRIESFTHGQVGWEALVEPSSAFRHPTEVLACPTLSREEKRAILASWASDACAVESAPALRMLPQSPEPTRLDDVLAALRALDEPDGEVARPRPIASRARKPSPAALRRLVRRWARPARPGPFH